ncbi:MAG: beta-ketoacyl-ACP synthase II [Candidatus Bostrichicola ureolyticus]|nr:MAG: beta-ketoacyl-ACP synthase II [Candidatus Bostrichicola ureolyticus]
MNFKRVIITGLGALTPIGNNVNDYWNSLINGKNGCNLIKSFDTTNFKTKFACEIKNYDQNLFFSKKEKHKLDLCTQYGIIASEEAIIDSGLKLYNKNKNRIGVIWGSGLGGILTFEQETFNFFKKNYIPRYNPFFIPKIIIDITAGIISINNGFCGPNYATVSSCASSANAIVDAYHLISLGKADIIIAGGSEAAITYSSLGGFNALNALSTRNNDYKTASRPFDRDRDGFVLGEGSGCIVIEEYEHAKSRKSKMYAEIKGVGLSNDAYHITAPDPEGKGIINAMKNALEDANIHTSEVDHINAHGTSTILGDITEIKAIEHLFKENVFNININSTKSMTGHLLGASCAIETIAAILPLTKNIIPPTINIFNIDKMINNKLNLTKNKAKKRNINISMCNTFGFGGHNVSIIYKKI